MTDQVETAIVTRPEQQQALASGRTMTPGQLATVLIEQKNFDVDKLARLMELQHIHEDRESAASHAQAFAIFQTMCPVVIRTGFNKHLGNQYVQWDAAHEQIRPYLNQAQLSVTHHITIDRPDWIEVEAIRQHGPTGHVVTDKMGGPPDTGPGRNVLQARKSTVSYLKTVTGFNVLGLRSRDRGKDEAIPKNITDVVDPDDDDGAGGKTTDPPKPKAQELADDAKAKAEGKLTPKQQFVAVCKEKASAPNMPMAAIKLAYEAVSKILALDDPALCLEYVQRADVEVHADGTVQKVDADAFDEKKE